MADEQVLIEIKVDNQQALRDLGKQNAKIQELEQSQKFLAQQGLKNTKEYQKQATQLKKLRSERNQNLKAISAEKGSLNELRANLANLTRQRNALTDVNGKNRDSFIKLNKEIKAQNESIKEAEQAGGDFRRNVGNYGDAIRQVTPLTGKFGTALEGVGQVIKLNPIGLLVSALVGLIAAWGQTEKGAKFFKIALAALNTIVETFVGFIGQGVNALLEFDTSWENIGNTIQDFVVNKVKKVIDGLGLIGKSISLLFKGEFSEAASAAAEGAKTLFVESNPLIGLWSAQIDLVTDLSGKIVDNVNATIKLEDANYKLQRAILGTQKEIAKLEGEENRLKSITEDSTLSFQEQAEAQTQLEAVQADLFQKRNSIVQQEINILNQRRTVDKANGKDTLLLDQEITEKKKEQIQIRNEQILNETENLKIARQRNQDIWEQELDFIIDVGEKEREIYLKRAEDESLSLEDRQSALASYQLAYEQFLNAQRTQLDEIGLDDDELNRLLGIKDPKELAESITALEGFTEKEKDRLREVLIEFKNSEFEKVEAVRKAEEDIQKSKKTTFELEIQQIQKARAQRAKAIDFGNGLLQNAFSIAQSLAGEDEKRQKTISRIQAISNTAVGITRAFSDLGPIGGIPASLSIAATGVAQLAAINNSSSGGSVSAPSGAGAANNPTINTSPQDQAFQQQQALTAALDNLGLTVSVTEINDAQNAVQVADSTATI